MKNLNKKEIIEFIKRNKIPLIIFLVVVVALIIGLIVSFNIGKKADGITKNEYLKMVIVHFQLMSLIHLLQIVPFLMST